MQEIMMQQMLEEYQRNQELLKFYMGPKKKSNESQSKPSSESPDLEAIEEMIEKLKAGVEIAKRDFELLMDEKSEENNKKGPFCCCE